MANSKYEYVKSFEVEDEVMLPNLIVVRIDGRRFDSFSEAHGFEKPNDARALNLMNSCAVSVMEEFPDVVFAYGFSDEFSFVFKRTTRFYQRRASKVLSLIVSFFTSSYATKWQDFFPGTELQYPLSFHGQITCCATIDYLQQYLAWRQYECHILNQYDTCFWMLVKQGKTEAEAKEALKGTQKQEKHELLFQQFEMNYKDLPSMFRQGSSVLRTEVFLLKNLEKARIKGLLVFDSGPVSTKTVQYSTNLTTPCLGVFYEYFRLYESSLQQNEEIVKYNDSGTPVVRMRKKPVVLHVENIASRSFWNEQSSLVKELGGFAENINKVRKESIRSFLFENKLMPSTWIVIRIDGCHFHRFSEIHEFEKPNDMQALNLMNSCAMAIAEEFQDIVFAYGVSDEYSFVLRKDSQFYQRQASKIVSVIVSFFSSMYVMKWKTFFPQKELKYPPAFDGRAVCYPSSHIIQDYLAWRQVDCHINNQYNTCFWMLVKSGKSKKEAQNILKGTQTREKNQLLKQQFGIDYTTLPVLFRHGSSIFRDTVVKESEAPRNVVLIEYCNIIEPGFWEAHPSILG